MARRATAAVVEESADAAGSVRPAAQKANRGKLRALGEIAKRFAGGGWRPATDVLLEVSAVPTRFPQVDAVTKVGGWPTARFGLVHGPSNEGKALVVTERVATPRGWRPIGELRVGDFVTGSDGRPTEVIGVYPQGEKDVFDVVADDGAVVRCCGEHLWTTTTDAELNRGRYERGPRPERKRTSTGVEGTGTMKTTAEIAATITDVHYLPTLTAPARFDGVPAPLVDPYVLGLLLGDGCLTRECAELCGADPELHDSVRRYAESIGDEWTEDRSPDRPAYVTRLRRGSGKVPEVRRRLEVIGVYRHNAHGKFIPDSYKTGSPETRLELLRGLFDTDGSVAGAKVEYSTVSDRLRDDVVDVARSLGARVAWHHKETYCGHAYVLRVTFADDTVPFRLSRKREAWKGRETVVRRRIVEVRPAGRAECVCIRVAAHDHLFAAEGYVLTHNSEFVLGLGASFLARDHFFALIDAEYTTPTTWTRQLMGDLHRHPGFVAMRPTSYEATVDGVRQFCEQVAQAREKGEVAADTTALVVVDSIRKLVPKRLLEALAKEGADGDGSGSGRFKKKPGGVDGYGGRAAQYKAALNAAWVDELIPLLGQTGVAMLAIARETEDPDSFAGGVKVGGGKALYYDSSIVVRVLRESYLYEGEDKRLIGERHRVEIHKTKIGGKDERLPDAHYHSSNGAAAPFGFDRPRDLLELAVERSVVEKDKGHRYAFRGERFGHGENAAVRRLHEDAELLASIDADVRSAVYGEDAR